MRLNFRGQTPLFLGMYEWELNRFFRRSIPGAQVAFDVGGHLGYDALMAAANMPGRVITFEPNHERAQALRDNVELNPDLASRITVCELFVGAGESDEQTTTIDAMSEKFGTPDFIKIDIDGGETDALRGGAKTLREHRPDLIVETHSPELERDCGELLVEYGYRPLIKHNRRIWREYRHGIGGIPHNRWLLAAGAG